MNNLRNHVSLIGNLGSDVQFRQLENGNAMAFVNMATNEDYKRNDEWVRETQWHRLVAWGKTAERLAHLAGKGTSIAVHGKLQYRQYTDKEGYRRQVTEIVIRNFTVSKPKTDNKQADQAQPALQK